tara:strand:- start:2137 stop:2238 length:102 start_codon:yes stop_codon:yes gene_type:complete
MTDPRPVSALEQEFEQYEELDHGDFLNDEQGEN